MPYPQSPLPRLWVDGQIPPSPHQQRRKSSEFGWFDIEPLLSARTASTQHVLWNDGDDAQEEYTSADEDSALPRALARVFDWLEEVEGPHNVRTSGVDETIIDADALLALSAPSSPVRRDSDEVVISQAVTKADFCLASRDQPSLAIGIYAHRIVRRSRWLFWSDCYAEYLVVIGTETELLRAWRCYSDFSSLAETAKALGAPTVTAYWDRLNQAIGGRRTTDPARLRTEVRCLGHFLTTLLEELRRPDIGILADFVREPTTYVVVGVENNGRDTANSDDSDEGFATDLDGIASNAPPVRKKVLWGSDCCYLGGRTLGTETRHPMKRKRMEQSLKPEPLVWDGL